MNSGWWARCEQAWRGQRWIDLPGPLRATRRDGLLAVASPAIEVDPD